MSNEKIPYIKSDIKLSDNIKFLNNGDVIIADTAEDTTVGKAIEVYNVHNNKIVSGLHTFACRPNFKFANKYLGYYLNSSAYHNQLLSIMQGIKVLSISKSNIGNTQIMFPKEEYQQKIADFLSLIDKRIDKQRQLVENLKKYKRGLLSAIFERKIRFKDDNGNDYPEWKEYKIKDVFTVTRGYVLATSEIQEEKDDIFKYPVYSSQTKNDGLMGYYNKQLYKNAITWTTDGANAGCVKYRDGDFYCTNVCGVLLNDNGYANSYIAEKLNSITKKHVSYVGNPKLMNNVMSEISIDFPSVEEQLKLSKIIDNLDSKIAREEVYKANLDKFKLGLLQQMFI